VPLTSFQIFPPSFDTATLSESASGAYRSPPARQRGGKSLP
jgi:hypothetical protein